MPGDEIAEYRVQSTSLSSAQVEDIEISRSENGQTRKVLRAIIVENGHTPDNTVKMCLVHQRRSGSVAWQDLEGVPLSSLRAGEAAKISLNTDETRAVAERLFDLYDIGSQGVLRGARVLTVANEEAVIETNEGKARLLRKIAESENLESLVQIEHEFGASISDAFAVSRLHASRREVLSEFEERLGLVLDENDWKRFLTRHSWIFGVSNFQVINETRLGIHHDTDIPFEVDGGFMDIVELKRPDEPFWRTNRGGSTFLYRGKFPVQSGEVTAALAQVTGYIFEAEKNANNTDFIRDHGGVVPIKPRGLVVVGRSNNWSQAEWQAFRLLNDELHGIQIITYDQLLNRAKKSLDLLLS